MLPLFCHSTPACRLRLRFSSEPAHLPIEAIYGRVRCKRLFAGRGINRKRSNPNSRLTWLRSQQFGRYETTEAGPIAIADRIPGPRGSAIQNPAKSIGEPDNGYLHNTNLQNPRKSNTTSALLL